MKKLLISLTVIFTVLFGVNEVEASNYSNCVSKCKNLPTSDKNTCEKSCYTSAIQKCKSSNSNSSAAIDACINNVDSESNNHKYTTLDSSVNECSYTVDCDTLQSKFPNYNIISTQTRKTEGIKGSESYIKIHISDDLKMSVIIDGEASHSNGNKDMVGSLCGSTYEGGSNQLQGINVTELFQDNSIGNTMINKGSCPKIKLGLHKDDGVQRLYAITEKRYNNLNIKFDKSYDITGSSSISNSTSNKMECYYSCRYGSANSDETIKIVKTVNNSFEIDISQKLAFKTDWWGSLANLIDCPSKVFINGDVGSFYIDTKEVSPSTASCTPVTEEDYYGDATDITISEQEDNYEVVCGVLTKNAQDFIYRILDWIKYIALILTVGLSILDFFKAVASEEDDAFKKAAKRLMRRVIVVIALFLLPVILEFILKLVHIQGINADDPLCTK